MRKQRRIVVEDCETLDSGAPIRELRSALALQAAEPSFGSTPCNFGGERSWLLCPACSRHVVKLYRPSPYHIYACRKCHNLTYRSSQQHDARLDRLIKAPREEIMEFVLSRNVKRALLGIKALYIRLGATAKYS